MKSIVRIVDPAMFARSNRSLFDAFIGLSIKLDELTSGDEFGSFEKLEILQNESQMMHMQLGMPIQVNCVLTPKGFDRETGFGRVTATALLYAKEGKVFSTHCSETPLEGTAEEVIDKLATAFVNRISSKACIGSEVVT